MISESFYNSHFAEPPSAAEELLKKLMKPGKPTKKILSQRLAAKALGIGRHALTVLIVTKQVQVTMVNGVEKITQAEIDRLVVEGWDRDAPMPSKKKTSVKKVNAAELGASIRKLKF